MADTWLSPTVLVSGAAAAISLISAGAALWAAWVSHRLMKRQREGDRPAISCKLDHGPSGWLVLQVSIDNRTSTGWVATLLEVRRPRNSVAVWEWDVMRQDDYGGFILSAEKLAGASGSSATLKIEVQPEGAAAASYTGRARGDRNSGQVYIRPPENSSQTLDMFLTVESLDPSAQQERYRIKRRIPMTAA